MLPPTTKGIERSTSTLPPPCEPELKPAVSSSFSSFSEVAMEDSEGPSSSSNCDVEAHYTASGKKRIEYDPEYFIESTFVVFQVENTLFRVPTYMLTHGSQLFNGMFRLPQPTSDGDSIEGLSASNPIMIPAKLGIKRDEFKAFVKALYPQSFSVTLHLTKTEWIAVLKLSRIWYFLDIRSVAITELERGGELSFVEKIVLGRSNWISSWVTEGLVGISDRDETVSDEDTIQIDYMTAVKLLRIRESRYKSMLQGGLMRNLTEEVQAVFSEELAHIASEEQAFRSPEPEVPFLLPDEDEDHLSEEELLKIEAEALKKELREIAELEDRCRREAEEAERRRQEDEDKRLRRLRKVNRK